MVKQSIGLGTFFPYVGKFPSFGSTPPGRVLQLRFPPDGFSNQVLLFVKPGHSTEECGNPNAVVPLVEVGDLNRAADTIRRHRPCPARRIFGDLIGAEPRSGLGDLERIADERQFEEVQGCGAYLWVLATIASAAPFIGLFGTVVGIMRAFHSMALVGTGGFGVVAGGISEALIATALGLAVGIVAVVCYNYFHARVERIDTALRIGSGRLIEAVATARRTHGA